MREVRIRVGNYAVISVFQAEAERVYEAIWEALMRRFDEELLDVEFVPSKARKYRCLICGETFDTKTGKGRMHMAYRHGYNLEGALILGKAEEVGE